MNGWASLSLPDSAIPFTSGNKAFPLFQVPLTLLSSLPLPTSPPGVLLGDLTSQPPQEVPEPESLPRIIFNGFLGCSPG